MSSFAAQVALSILLSLTALGVALVLPPHPLTWAVALSLGVVVVITCPSPP
jgi:hypothetical protein